MFSINELNLFFFFYHDVQKRSDKEAQFSNSEALWSTLIYLFIFLNVLYK